MSEANLKDLSKTYQDQISEKKKDDSYLEPDMKKRQANNEKARKELAKGPQMKNPHFEALDPVGQEDGDIDNDGDKDKSDKYLAKRRKAIGKAMKKESLTTSDWRNDLSEVMTDDIQSKPIKEKKVNNKVTINPKLGEAVEELGGTLLEEIEVDELGIIVEEVYDELIEEGYSEDDVESAIEDAMEATVSFGHDTKELKKDGSQVGSKRKFLKRKAGEFLQKAKKKVGMAVAQGRVDAYNKKREVKQVAGDKAREVKTSAKRGIKNLAQKVVSRMSEEIVSEAVYGGTPSEKKDTRMVVTNADKKANTPAYQKMKAGDKRYKAADHMGEDVETVAEDDKSYDRNRKRAAQRAADRNAARAAGKTGVVPGVGYVTPNKERETYTDSKGTVRHKSGAKNEEVEVEGYEPMTPAREKRVSRQSDKAYAKEVVAARHGKGKEANKQMQRRIAMQDPAGRKASLRKEDASMSPQEIQLQKKKAMLDRMIAQKRQQGLNKVKTSEAPAKAMGEETEDSLKDRRMERGGVDGNNRYNSATKNVAMGGGKKKPYDGMSALEKVKASIRAKHGQGAIKEDAKMAKQSDEKLAALHKQVSSSDQSLPSNQFMMKRVSKEMNRRKKAT